ncbi:MAG: acetamidase [Tindallia sp. MSAO_Bac2]|nr:MAG: acetamidase [Tindallia sp. MSAO_Bac2]
MLKISKDRVHFAFDAAETPVAFAESGDEVTFCTQDCYCEQIVEDGYDFSRIDMNRNNPATGPLFIKDAEPGDLLRVEIRNIRMNSEGSMTVRSGAGIYEIEGYHCRRFSIEGKQIIFDQGIRIPVKPMVGVMGTAPEGAAISTQSPGEHGGNLDIKDLGEGAILYLPANVPGALLSMGDIHAVQGDGETVICAMEVSGEITVKVDVLKERNDIPTPFILTESNYLTTAANASLDQSSVEAAHKMHRFLQQHTELSDAQCGMLLSLAGNLRISQVVNPEKGCIMEFPVGLAKETFIR